jgi:hypothetical protein
MTNTIIGAIGLFFLATVAYTSAQPAPCVSVDVTLHSYDGPVVILDACMSKPAVYDGALHIEIIDGGSSIFRGNFEVWP